MNTSMLLADESKIYATMGTLNTFISSNPNIIGVRIKTDHDGEKSTIQFYQYSIGCEITPVDIVLLSRIKPNIDDLYDLLNDNIDSFFTKVLGDIGYTSPINSDTDDTTGITYSVEKKVINDKLIKKGEILTDKYLKDIYFKSSIAAYYIREKSISANFEETVLNEEKKITKITISAQIDMHGKTRNAVLMILSGNKKQFEQFIIYKIQQDERFKEYQLSMNMFSDPTMILGKSLEMNYVFERKDI